MRGCLGRVFVALLWPSSLWSAPESKSILQFVLWDTYRVSFEERQPLCNNFLLCNLCCRQSVAASVRVGVERKPTVTLGPRRDLRTLSTVHSVQVSERHLLGTAVLNQFQIFLPQRHLKMVTRLCFRRADASMLWRRRAPHFRVTDQVAHNLWFKSESHGLADRCTLSPI